MAHEYSEDKLIQQSTANLLDHVSTGKEASNRLLPRFMSGEIEV